MKTLRLPIVLMIISLAVGCATCRQNSDAQAASTTQATPFWKEFFGWFFGCAAESAVSYGQYQQNIQSGDPTR